MSNNPPEGRRALPLLVLLLPTITSAQAPLLTLTSNSPDGVMAFGHAVSWVPDVDGDGHGDLLIGAYNEVVAGAGNAGRAHLFSGATGVLLRALESPNPETSGSFGFSVSGVPDVNGDGRGDLLIGALFEDVGAIQAGRAYLFSGASGALLHTLTSPDPGIINFGISVAGVPNADGDGRGDLLVGAGTQAYLFSGDTGVLLRTFISPNPNAVWQSNFGKSVASVPDANGDGRDDLLIGASIEDTDSDPNPREEQGLAYLYSGATGTLLRILTSPNAESGGSFGYSVSGVPDADGDGRGDLLVGAVGEDGGVRDSGRAYLFSGSNGLLLRALTSPDPERDGGFGVSVSGVADNDGDGRSDLIIGTREDGGAPEAGRVYLFSGAGGAPLRALISPNAESGGSFGYSVSGVPDADGDGRGDLLVGAWQEDGGTVNGGRAYLFYSDAGVEPVGVSFFNVPFGPLVNGGEPIAEGTLGNGPPARVCADGSTATRIVLSGALITATTIGDLEVELIGDIASGEEAKYLGSLTAPLYDPDEEGAVVTYTHPRLVNSDEASFRAGLRVRFEGVALGTYPIGVYRAPVLMVHGLWSDRGAFEDMEESLEDSGRWPDLLLRRMDYSTTNARHFSENVGRLRLDIRRFIALAVVNKFSAGRADVVGHSMGGILTRLYLQAAGYSSEPAKINRLITLNTPHSGSQFANFIIGCSDVIHDFLETLDKPTDEGAVDDLRVDSDAILNDLNGSMLNRHETPSHTLITLEDNPWFLNFLAADLSEGCNVGPYGSIGELATDLFGEPNDVIVAERSQLGGVEASATTLIEDQIHTKSPENQEVIGAVSGLLGSDPMSSNFTDDGFHPPTLEYIPLPPQNSLARRNGLDVTITTPRAGAVVAPGDEISVTAMGSGDTDRLVLAVGGPFALPHAAAENGSSATFRYVIPEEAVGPLAIAVLAVDDAGAFGNAAVRVVVEPTAVLDSLTAYPEKLIVSADGPTGLSITGHYADDVERDLTRLPGLAYAVADPRIAAVTEAGEVVGVSEGTTSMSVSYGGQAVEVDVLVIPAPPSVGAEPIPEDDRPTSTALLPAYPNPSTGSVVIPFRLPSRQRLALRVYDVLGREVRVLLDGEVGAGLHEVRLDGRGLPSGVYLVRMEAEDHREVRTVTLLR